MLSASDIATFLPAFCASGVVAPDDAEQAVTERAAAVGQTRRDDTGPEDQGCCHHQNCERSTHDILLGSVPAAPLSLVDVAIVPRGGGAAIAGDWDFVR